MDIVPTETPLTERKVLRRGLIAGLGGLGAAALLRLKGADRVEANGETMIVGDSNPVGYSATLTTGLSANCNASALYISQNGTGSNACGLFVGGSGGGGGMQAFAYAGGADVAGVRGANLLNGTGVIGSSDNGSFAVGQGSGIGVQGLSGSGKGVYGKTLSGGFGVWGTDFSGGIGVNGLSSTSSADLGDGAGCGVQGTAGTGNGVHGAATGTIGLGVRGANKANGTGVKGVSNAVGFAFDGDGSGNGVHGKSGTGSGVVGEATLSVGPGAFGVRGVAAGNGTGVRGVSNAGGDLNALGTGSGIGVHGKSGSGPGVKGESSSGAGVLGLSDNQPGVDGTSTNSLGIRGTSTNFVGIVGISTNSHGLYGSTNAGVNGFGIVAENLGANGRGMLVTGGAPSQFYGGLQVFGQKNAVLKMQDGSFASVYCQESPEPYFEDFGRAQLVGGVANVPLEREFATLVAGGDYMVFLTPEGPSAGLYVSRRSPAGFEVRDAAPSNVSFTYRIVTRRKDIEGKRFARVSTEAAEKVAGVRAVLAGMGAAGSTSGPSGPSSPLPPKQAVPPSFTNTPPVIPGGTGYTNLPPGAGPSGAAGNPGTGR